MTPLRAGEAPSVGALIERLEQRTGLSFGGSLGHRLVTSLQERMRVAGLAEASAYERALEEDADLFQSLADALTVGESYFFREPRQLDLLAHVAIPDLHRRNPLRHELSIWSAGCAAGQEPYTLAMLLHDHPVVARYQVLGTDLSAAAIERAEAATYGRWALRSLDAEARERYFDAARGGYRVPDRYRRQVRFLQANLRDGSPRGRFDIVVCRNVLIYLTPTAIEQVAASLRDALAPDGWLITASSDPPLSAEGLRRVRTPYGLAYRRQVAPSMASPRRVAAPGVRAVASDGERRPAPITAAAAPPAPTRAAVAQADEDPSRRVMQAADALHERDLDAAASIARSLIVEGYDDVETHIVLLRALGDRGETHEAAAVADAAIARHPFDPRLRYLAAALLLDAGRPAEAATAAAAALYADPSAVAPHLLLARIDQQLGHDDAARRGLERARRMLSAMAPADVVPYTGECASVLQAAIGAPDDEGHS